MSKQITLEDVRPGDQVTLTYKGHAFTGEAYLDEDGDLLMGRSYINIGGDWIVGNPYSSVLFISATRMEVPLPTKVGAIVRGTAKDDPTVTKLFCHVAAEHWDFERWRDISTTDFDCFSATRLEESYEDFEVLFEGVDQ